MRRIKKNRFFVFKNFKRICVGLVAVAILIATALPFSAKASNANNNKFVVVIDAGHGGRDGGCVGASGVLEKDLTLQYASTLKDICKDFGFDVELTRKTDDGLYDAFAPNKKLDDLNKRLDIIKKAKPNLLISLHMNSFSSSSVKGSNVFYKSNNSQSQVFADNIKSQFISSLQSAKNGTKSGDFYLLNESSCPSVLVECGFISNIQEEKLLQTKEYEQKLCYAIFCGILNAISK